MTSTYYDTIISGWALVGHSSTYKFGNIGMFITSVNHTKNNIENEQEVTKFSLPGIVMTK